ncbi:hypothetical protein GCM10028786_14550 [Flaviaesturariibacter terrae]
MVILLHDGTVVARRRSKEGLCFLFQMEFFYAEAFFPAGSSDVSEFRCFTGTGPLAPYLESISLEGILE